MVIKRSWEAERGDRLAIWRALGRVTASRRRYRPMKVLPKTSSQGTALASRPRVGPAQVSGEVSREESFCAELRESRDRKRRKKRRARPRRWFRAKRMARVVEEEGIWPVLALRT